MFYEYFHNSDVTILFIHGLGVNHTVWKNEIKYFKKKYSVLTVDLLNHGKSPVKKNLRFKNFSKSIHDLILKLRIKKLIIVGHSMGGVIALDYYKKYPKNIKSLIIADSTYKAKNSFRWLLPLAGLFGWIVSIFEPNVPYINYSKLKNVRDVEILYKSDLAIDNHYSDSLSKDLLNIDFSKSLSRIKVPTLIVKAKKDQFFKMSIAKEMVLKIKDAHLKVIPGTHTSLIKNYRQFNKVVDEFLEEIL